MMMRLGHLPTEVELKRMVAEVDQVHRGLGVGVVGSDDKFHGF